MPVENAHEPFAGPARRRSDARDPGLRRRARFPFDATAGGGAAGPGLLVLERGRIRGRGVSAVSRLGEPSRGLQSAHHQPAGAAEGTHRRGCAGSDQTGGTGSSPADDGLGDGPGCASGTHGFPAGAPGRTAGDAAFAGSGAARVGRGRVDHSGGGAQRSLHLQDDPVRAGLGPAGAGLLLPTRRRSRGGRLRRGHHQSLVPSDGNHLQQSDRRDSLQRRHSRKARVCHGRIFAPHPRRVCTPLDGIPAPNPPPIFRCGAGRGVQR